MTKPAVRVDEANFEDHIMDLLKSKQNFQVASFRDPEGKIYFDFENTGFTHIPVPNPLPPISNDMLNEDKELRPWQREIVVQAQQARQFFVGDFPDSQVGKTLDAPLVPIPRQQAQGRATRLGINYQELIAQAAREWANMRVRDGFDATDKSRANVKLAEHKLEWLVQAERHLWSPSTYTPPESQDGT